MKPALRWLYLILPFLVACNGSHPTAIDDPGSAASSQPKGKQLMDQYCGACHVVPTPADLDQKTWKNHILIRMGAYMGIYNDLERYYDSVPEKWLEPGIGGQRVRTAGIYPDKPVLPRPDWEALRDYILANAPSATYGPSGLQSISRELPGFKARKLQPDANLQPLVTAVAVMQPTAVAPQDPAASGIYAAFLQQSLLEITPEGKPRGRIDGIYAPVQIKQGDFIGLAITDIGSMKGSDHPKGSVKHYWDTHLQRIAHAKPLDSLDSLMRPVMTDRVDLDQDGDLDDVVAEFGYHMGALAWYETYPGGASDRRRHVLHPDDGTVAFHVADFTGDSLPDILALKANADEGVDLYRNLGKGEFERKNLFRFNPTYGCTALEVVDWDHDGKLDFLLANGDNGDYPPILKGNHGIRLYLNRGSGKFEEGHSWPMNGTYGLRVRDFDEDGDYDVAAVSFYPDFKNRPEETFVYFQNKGGMQFSAHTFPEVDLGRWMVMDAGDIDGDKDIDIVLGAFDVKSDDCSEATYDHWLKENVPLMVLENQLR